MRVLFDGNIFSMQATGGINCYFANVIDHLPQTVTPILTSKSRPRFHCPCNPRLESHVKEFRRGPRFMKKRRSWKYFRKLNERLEFDLIHPTYYSPLSGQGIADCHRPIVLTVYDMIHERFPDLVDPRGKNAALKRQAIQAAQAIICISHSTKRDFLEIYPESEDRVSVIHLATSIGLDTIDWNTEIPAQPFFLYVGSRAAYKNFDRLLDAMRSVVASSPDCCLCVVGGPFTKREREGVAEKGLSRNIVHFGYATDGQLARLYNASIALVYPSQYEGFGIPLLEAMRCGTAVVAASTSSIPEVAGNAALLFDPNSTDELCESLLDLLNNTARRAAFVQRGSQRASQFSWQHTAEQTMEIYRATANTDAVDCADSPLARRSA